MTTSTRRFPVPTSRMTISSPRLSPGTSSPSFVSLSRLVGSRRQREFDFYYHVNNLRTTEPQYGYCYWCIWNCRRNFQFYRPIETNSVFCCFSPCHGTARHWRSPSPSWTSSCPDCPPPSSPATPCPTWTARSCPSCTTCGWRPVC